MCACRPQDGTPCCGEKCHALRSIGADQCGWCVRPKAPPKPAFIDPSDWRAVFAAAGALKVAAPWEKVTDNWWQRFEISTSCRLEAVASVTKLLAGWSGTICNGPVRIDALPTLEAAKAGADAALVADGWILSDEEAVST
jgi:hypothetical protein